MTTHPKLLIPLTLAGSTTAAFLPPLNQHVHQHSVKGFIPHKENIARILPSPAGQSCRDASAERVKFGKINPLALARKKTLTTALNAFPSDDFDDTDDNAWESMPSDQPFDAFGEQDFELSGQQNTPDTSDHSETPPSITLDDALVDILSMTQNQQDKGRIRTEHLLANLLEQYPDPILTAVGVTAAHIHMLADLPDAAPNISPDLMKIYQPHPGTMPSAPSSRPSTKELIDAMCEELKVIISHTDTQAPISPIDLRDAIISWAHHFKDSSIGSFVNGAIAFTKHSQQTHSTEPARQPNTERQAQGPTRFSQQHPTDHPTTRPAVGLTSPVQTVKPIEPPRSPQSPAVQAWRRAQMTTPVTKTIDELCDDLTKQAANGEIDPIVGRDKEINQLAIALQSMKKGSALVVGPPGTGKTALIEGLAKKIVEGELPALKNYRLVSLPVSNLVAGSSLRGSLEEKVKELIKEARNQPIILFMDEFHSMIGAGKAQGESSDLADMFKSARGLKIIGCTTEKEYTEKFKADPAFARRFELIKFPEPDKASTRSILDKVVEQLSAHHQVSYENSALDTTQTLAKRFVAGHSPDKEITILDRAGAYASHHNISVIDSDLICAQVEQSTGIPLTRIQSKESHSPNEIANALKTRVIGQDDAVDAVTNAIFQARTGVNPNRPSVIVFCGPTGTGKTELAKAIAQIDGRHFIRIDMETVKSINTLRGAEPGYIGYEREGILTGPQKLHPYSLVLFDEIEKAPDDVLKGLLGLLDDGELTDGRGERILFNNAIIIFTTNFGAHTQSGASEAFGFNLPTHSQPQTDEKKRRTQDTKFRLGERLGPEYINRFRNFVLFDELSQSSTEKIVAKNLKDIGMEIGEAKNLQFHFHPKLIQAIAAQGHDPQSGAREVRRICDNLIRSSIGRLLLEHPELGNTDHTYKVAFTLSEDFQLHIGVQGMGDQVLHSHMTVSPDLRDIDIR